MFSFWCPLGEVCVSWGAGGAHGSAWKNFCFLFFLCFLFIYIYIYLYIYIFLLDTGFTFLRNVHVLWVRAPLEMWNHNSLRIAVPEINTVSLSLFFHILSLSFVFHEPSPFTTHRHRCAISLRSMSAFSCSRTRGEPASCEEFPWPPWIASLEHPLVVLAFDQSCPSA